MGYFEIYFFMTNLSNLVPKEERKLKNCIYFSQSCTCDESGKHKYIGTITTITTMFTLFYISIQRKKM